MPPSPVWLFVSSCPLLSLGLSFERELGIVGFVVARFVVCHSPPGLTVDVFHVHIPLLVNVTALDALLYQQGFGFLLRELGHTTIEVLGDEFVECQQNRFR